MTYPRGSGFVCVLKGRLYVSSNGRDIIGYRIKKAFPRWVDDLRDGYPTTPSFIERLSEIRLLTRMVLITLTLMM